MREEIKITRDFKYCLHKFIANTKIFSLQMHNIYLILTK